jgi:hypothetical protein
MFIKSFLLNIILLFSVCFAQTQDTSASSSGTSMTSESTNGETTVVTLTTGSTAGTESTTSNPTGSQSTIEGTSTLESTASSSSIVSNPSTSIYSITTAMSIATSEAEISSTVFQVTNPSSAVASSMVSELSNTVLPTSETSISSANTVLTTSQTSISSASTISTTIGTTSATTNAPIATNISVTYKYSIESNISLQIGIINNNVTQQNVQNLVSNSFNLPNFSIKILQCQIELPARRSFSYAYDLLVSILFASSRTDCDITCIEKSKVAPMINILLPDTNGTLVMIYVPSSPLLENIVTTTAGNYPFGGSSPGVPAQIGMGLGISLIGILLIIEIVVLYRKYGASKSSRHEQYVMTPTG